MPSIFRPSPCSHNGVEIATGPLSLLDEAVRARSTAEGAIAAAARAAGQMARIQARSDALDLKERDLEQREDACRVMQADAVRRFADSVLELKHRFDRFEQRRIADALRDLPDTDHPEGLSKAAQDDLEAICEAPGPRHRERERELAEAEDVIGDELQLHHGEPDDGDPAAVPATTKALEALMGEPFEGGRLPEGTVFPVKHDSLGLLGQRARKAACRLRTNGARR
jgi:hypothetical protein